MKQITAAEALNRAASYCTLCERCISEVSNKLTVWGVEIKVQQDIIKRLIDENFINEERYSKAFVNDKIRFNHWGRKKISAALYEKRISKSIIGNAIATIDEEEYNEILHKVLSAKHKELKYREDNSTRQKLLRFAASRGFETQLLIKALKISNAEMDF